MDIAYSFLLPILEWFAQVTRSYGWGILALTLIVRIAVWPLVNSSTRSMQKMSSLQPKMKALQEKYKDNPEMMQRKLVEFYQKNKMNPMGGCLPMLVQLPVLFALFATIAGPPFQDKGIPVKVTLLKPEAAMKATLTKSTTSGANSPYVSPTHEMAKLAVQPGDTTMEFNGEPQVIDFHVIPVEGKLPQDFKPHWKVAQDTNAATMVPATGVAVFPKEGNIIVEAVLPEPFKPIQVPVKVVAKGPGDEPPPLIGWMTARDPFKEKTERSAEQTEGEYNGKQFTLFVTPGASTIAAGGQVQFQLRTADGSALPDIHPTWRIAKDDNAATIDDDGKASFPNAGEVTVEAVIPAVAREEKFFFIDGLGKVATGMALLDPRNLDILGMILGFAATMYLSSALMSTPTATMDPEQAAIQKQTQQIMPITLSAMFIFFPLPAGVFLYMLFSNVLQILQTWMIKNSPGAEIIDVDDDTDGDGGDDNGKKNLIEDRDGGGETVEKTVKLSKKKQKKK